MIAKIVNQKPLKKMQKMNQSNYEVIIACIQHGAPALATSLINSFNSVIEKANKYLDIKQQEEEAKRKAEIIKNEEAAKTTQPTPSKK